MQRFIAILSFCFTLAACAQCTPRVVDMSDTLPDAKSIRLPAPRGVTLPEEDFVTWSYELKPGLKLSLYSRQDGQFILADGLILTKASAPAQVIPLTTFHEFTDGYGTDRMDIGYFPMALATACDAHRPVFLMTFHWLGDVTSPQVSLLLLPGGDGVQIISMTPLSGGTVELSRSGPLHLRTWDNLHEGSCNACETHYEIRDYVLRSGRLIETRHRRSFKRITSSDPLFDNPGVRFVESRH